MTGLVTMIVLAYLLVIAVCVAIWSAVSLRRGSSGASAPRSARVRQETGARHEAGDRRARRPTAHERETDEREDVRGASHDSYRGARAARADAPAARRGRAAPAPAPAVASAVRPAVAGPATQNRLFAPDGTPVPESRISDARRARGRGSERAPEQRQEDPAGRPAEQRSAERRTREDPFDRFLRANDDFER